MQSHVHSLQWTSLRELNISETTPTTLQEQEHATQTLAGWNTAVALPKLNSETQAQHPESLLYIQQCLLHNSSAASHKSNQKRLVSDCLHPRGSDCQQPKEISCVCAQTVFKWLFWTRNCNLSPPVKASSSSGKMSFFPWKNKKTNKQKDKDKEIGELRELQVQRSWNTRCRPITGSSAKWAHSWDNIQVVA